MTAWIVAIDRENPQHREYAQQYGYWDITVARPFSPGDVLYFWQARQSLLGSVLVTRGTAELAPGTPMPWNLDDDKRGAYRCRVEFEVLHASSVGHPTWSELRRATGVRVSPNSVPRVPTGGGVCCTGR